MQSFAIRPNRRNSDSKHRRRHETPDKRTLWKCPRNGKTIQFQEIRIAIAISKSVSQHLCHRYALQYVRLCFFLRSSRLVLSFLAAGRKAVECNDVFVHYGAFCVVMRCKRWLHYAWARHPTCAHQLLATASSTEFRFPLCFVNTICM